MRPNSNHNESILSRGRKSDDSLSLEPKAYGIILRTPTPKDHVHVSDRPPTEKTYALDVSEEFLLQPPKLILPYIDSVESAFAGTTVFSDNSSTLSIQSKPLKKVYPPTTYFSFKSSQDKSSKELDRYASNFYVSFQTD
jgi:hypothetical protein